MTPAEKLSLVNTLSRAIGKMYLSEQLQSVRVDYDAAVIPKEQTTKAGIIQVVETPIHHVVLTFPNETEFTFPTEEKKAARSLEKVVREMFLPHTGIEL